MQYILFRDGIYIKIILRRVVRYVSESQRVYYNLLLPVRYLTVAYSIVVSIKDVLVM